MVKIGGVTVARGGTIRWGALLSVLLGAPIYALEISVIGTLETWRRGIGDAVRGFTEWVVVFISTPLDGVALAFRTAEATFVASLPTQSVVSVRVPLALSRAFPGAASRTSPMELNLGVFAFAVAVGVAFLTVYAAVRSFEVAWGGLRG